VSPDDPTDVMPGDPDEPTKVNPAGEEPTRRIVVGDERRPDLSGAAGEGPTRTLIEGDEGPTESMGGSPPPPARTVASGGGNRGIGVLVAAIVASLVLVVAYVAAGGPVGPDRAADPCDPRHWTDPQDLEEAAQQFALSAADGAACELGVSREELTRSIPDEQTRLDFMEEHGFTDADLEEALRAGLNRAVDDAENAGALGGLAATGIRAAIRAMPMSVMVGLLENADGIFNGDLGSLGGVGDAIDAITQGLDGLGSGTTDDPLGSLGDAIEGALPEGTTDDLNELLPEKARKRLQDAAKDRLKQGVDGLLAP